MDAIKKIILAIGAVHSAAELLNEHALKGALEELDSELDRAVSQAIEDAKKDAS